MKGYSTKYIARLTMSTFVLVVGVPLLGADATFSVASAAQPAPCAGGNLWAGLVSTNGAGGTNFYTIAFINIGRTSCRLAGYPMIAGASNGLTHNLVGVHENVADDNLAPTILAPQMAGILMLSTGSECNALNTGGQTKLKKTVAANTYTVLIVKLPRSSGSVLVQGVSLDVACGLGISQLGWKKG